MTKSNRILFLGPQGVGKTFLTHELRKDGYDTADTDDIPHFSHWFNLNGKEVKSPKDPDIKWYDAHKLVWNREEIEEFVRHRPNIILFAVISDSLFDFSNIFDRIYYLDLKPEVWWDRIVKRQPEVYGRFTSEGKAAMLKFYAALEESAKKRGYKIVDMSGSKESVAMKIKKIIDEKNRVSI